MGDRRPRTQSAAPAIVAVLALLLSASMALAAPARASAGLQAEDPPGLTVAVSRVESDAFPQVAAWVTLTSADGWPLTDVASDRFSVLEDGVPVPEASVAFANDDSQPVALVLALDVSTAAKTLSEMQQAAVTLIDALGERDQMAIVTFYSAVQIAQPFTSDKAHLRGAVEQLTVPGSSTALYEAILTASAMLAEQPEARKALVVVTDSENNVAGVSAYEAFHAANEQGAPVYVLGLTSQARSGSLVDIVRLTGGQFLSGVDPDGAVLAAQAVEKLIWHGYQVSYQSSLQADDADHELAIQVTGEEGAAEDRTRFTARSGAVSVTLLGAADGETLRGAVPLAAEVNAPAQVVSVEFALDGATIGLVDAAPYHLEWNSASASPGLHTLTARAVDAVGNQGEAQVAIEVAAPLAVTLSVPQQVITIGQSVVIDALVDAVSAVTEVELRIDNGVVSVVDAAPYRFTVDTSTYAPGDHLVIVHARDQHDHTAEAQVNLRLTAPPARASGLAGWVRGLLLALVAVVLVVIDIVALRSILKWQKRRYQKLRRLEVRNLGNVPSRYQLRATEPAGSLRFQFAINGRWLGQTELQPAESGTLPAQTQASASGPAQPSGQDVRTQAGQMARQVGDLSGTLAGALSGVGRFVPGSAGALARSQAQTIREQQRSARELTQAPSRAMGRARGLGRRVTGGR
ncbi:MAG: VWA domain-containing protein, partial [Anaerolineales bacterium]|nr:VWA domain-containing protein [Anaerolineales bacterium]